MNKALDQYCSDPSNVSYFDYSQVIYGYEQEEANATIDMHPGKIDHHALFL